jgi:hypothetical protein
MGVPGSNFGPECGRLPSRQTTSGHFMGYFTGTVRTGAVQCRMIGWMMNWKGSVRKKWYSRYCPGVFLEGLRKTTGQPMFRPRFKTSTAVTLTNAMLTRSFRDIPQTLHANDLCTWLSVTRYEVGLVTGFIGDSWLQVTTTVSLSYTLQRSL